MICVEKPPKLVWRNISELLRTSLISEREQIPIIIRDYQHPKWIGTTRRKINYGTKLFSTL